MTLNKIYDIKDNQVIVQLPDTFKGKKKVLVSVSDVEQTKKQKIELMKKAFKDAQFLKDLNEVSNDFAGIENENWR